MLVDVKVDNGLSDDMVLYRIVDFYSAAILASSNRFFFSRSDTFIDKNEIVFSSLSSLYQTRMMLGCGARTEVGVKDVEERHNRFKRSHYISSWSRNGESVALWSLYSPDHCGVRIAVRVSSLRSILQQLANKYDFDRLTEHDIGRKAVVSVSAMIANVVYVSLESILRTATKRANAATRLLARNPEAFQFPSLEKQSAQQKEKATRVRNIFAEDERFATYKDISFKHEDEVRLILHVGTNDVDAKFLSFGQKVERDPERKVNRMILSSHLDGNQMPAFESTEFPCSDVVSFCIDPRCPTHKKEFIENYFRENGCQVVTSSCFGYLPNNFTVFPLRPA